MPSSRREASGAYPRSRFASHRSMRSLRLCVRVAVGNARSFTSNQSPASTGSTVTERGADGPSSTTRSSPSLVAMGDATGTPCPASERASERAQQPCRGVQIREKMAGPGPLHHQVTLVALHPRDRVLVADHQPGAPGDGAPPCRIEHQRDSVCDRAEAVKSEAFPERGLRLYRFPEHGQPKGQHSAHR